MSPINCALCVFLSGKYFHSALLERKVPDKSERWKEFIGEVESDRWFVYDKLEGVLLIYRGAAAEWGGGNINFAISFHNIST